MVESESNTRIFPEWSMGFKSATAQEMQEFQGYVNPKGQDFLKSANGAPVVNLLKTFANTNRM